jgi:ABC-type amino acid transport substrate-binding protein
MFTYLEEGKIDVNVMSRTAEREAYAGYGRETMFSSSYRPFVRADRNHDIRSLQDLDGLRVGHLAGLECSPAYRSYIDARIAEGTVVVTTTQESLIRMLLADRIDVFVLPRESLSWRVHTMGARDQIRSIDLDIRTSDYYVTVSRNSELVADNGVFLEAMDACLIQAKRDGSHARILHRYGIE